MKTRTHLLGHTLQRRLHFGALFGRRLHERGLGAHRHLVGRHERLAVQLPRRERLVRVVRVVDARALDVAHEPRVVHGVGVALVLVPARALRGVRAVLYCTYTLLFHLASLEC